MEFKLNITLGNDAMLSGDDLAEALENVAASIRSVGTVEELDEENFTGNIRDINGNTVGRYYLEGAV